MNFIHCSKALSNRYFPLGPAQLIPRVAAFSTYSSIYKGDTAPAIDLHLYNCITECNMGHQLCVFRRGSWLAFFSLPQILPAGLTCKAVDAALAHFLALDRAPWPTSLRNEQFMIYRAFLGPLAMLTIAGQKLHGYRVRRSRTLMLGKRSSDCKGLIELLRIPLYPRLRY